MGWGKDLGMTGPCFYEVTWVQKERLTAQLW